mmetsp:Transcript_20136/g.52566  ORF Transcript_20136/g.52566 Transcript_20136/m.52566 type:complete len:142 (+) Transcript_20136:116-541(+)
MERRRGTRDEEDAEGGTSGRRGGSPRSAGSALCYGPYVVLLLVALLFASLYVSFNFRLVSRAQEAHHTLEVQHYMKLANEARKELEKWKRGVEEKDLVIRDLEYKVAVAKKTKDEYIEALKIKDKQMAKLAAHPNPQHGRR